MSAIRRLLLLLLPLVLALGPMPAAAAPAAPGGSHASMHDGAHAMHGMMDQHERAPTTPDHHTSALCLGCVAPATLGMPVLAEPYRAAMPLTLLRLPVLAAPMAPQPATPPPRTV